MTLLLGLLGLAAAADFHLISSTIVTTPASSGTNDQGRFTLHQVKLTALPQSTQPAAKGVRYTLTSSAGSIVFVQQPQLPELHLQNQLGVWEIVWFTPPLLEGLVLESTSAVQANTWQVVASELTSTGGRMAISPPAPGSSVKFYRLRKL